MGMYDTVWVSCPECGEEIGFQSKGGECNLANYTLKDCPGDVMGNINRHSPEQCDCGKYYRIDIPTRTMVAVSVPSDLRPVPSATEAGGEGIHAVAFGKHLARQGWKPYSENAWENSDDETASTEAIYADFKSTTNRLSNHFETEEDFDYARGEQQRELVQYPKKPAVPSASVEGKERDESAEKILDKHLSHSTYQGYNSAGKKGTYHDDDNCIRCKIEDDLIAAMKEYAALASSPAPAQVGGRDPFVEKHLARVRDKMKESMVEMHIQRNREILKPSIEHFLSGGNVNGQFRQSLLKMMNPAIFAAPSADAGKHAYASLRLAVMNMLLWLKEHRSQLPALGAPVAMIEEILRAYPADESAPQREGV